MPKKALLAHMLLVVVALSGLKPSLAASYSVFDGSIVRDGHKYCWYGEGWNGAGWYRCGFENRPGKGWGGPKGWESSDARQPSSGAWFELPPPTPPVSAPGIASERYVEPLRGGPAAGTPATPLRR
ncbi:MAG TPA: hypothetical protein VH558_02635 [Pseudolabrys sp.]|jgi:hypothetical protein